MNGKLPQTGFQAALNSSIEVLKSPLVLVVQNHSHGVDELPKRGTVRDQEEGTLWVWELSERFEDTFLCVPVAILISANRIPPRTGSCRP